MRHVGARNHETTKEICVFVSCFRGFVFSWRLSMTSISRRHFVVSTLGGLGVAAVSTRSARSGQGPSAPAIATAAAAESGWFDRPMRWAQLTLVENDPGRFDPALWLDSLTRIHADAACLSAGGVVAYYPTKIPLHHRSVWIGESDPFGDLVAGCRKLGMVVIARTDPHAVHQDVYDAHPDWIAVEADGQKRRHWASPELWLTCARRRDGSHDPRSRNRRDRSLIPVSRLN